MARRLSKIEAAAYFGVSPSTIDRRIAREELKVERDSPRTKVWVIIDDSPDGEPLDEPRDGSENVEVMVLRERVLNLETVLQDRQDRQRESDALVQQLLQELHAAHNQVDDLTARVLPAARKGRRRLWWPFRQRGV